MYKKWLNTLKNIELFESIEQVELSRMISCLKPKIVSYNKKDYIAIADDVFIGVGIILKGEIAETKENAAGDRIIIAKLKAKDIFGDRIAFSGNNKWDSTIVALSQCEILYITPNVILGTCSKLCKGHTQLIQNMLKIISKKAISLNKNIEYLSMKSIRKKVSAYLLEQYRINKNKKFEIPLKRIEWAEFLNVTRPSLSREIIKMKAEGAIDFNRAFFEIKDIDVLKMYI